MSNSSHSLTVATQSRLTGRLIPRTSAWRRPQSPILRQNCLIPGGSAEPPNLPDSNQPIRSRSQGRGIRTYCIPQLIGNKRLIGNRRIGGNNFGIIGTNRTQTKNTGDNQKRPLETHWRFLEFKSGIQAADRGIMNHKDILDGGFLSAHDSSAQHVLSGVQVTAVSSGRAIC